MRRCVDRILESSGNWVGVVTWELSVYEMLSSFMFTLVVGAAKVI